MQGSRAGRKSPRGVYCCVPDVLLFIVVDFK